MRDHLLRTDHWDRNFHSGLAERMANVIACTLLNCLRCAPRTHRFGHEHFSPVPSRVLRSPTASYTERVARSTNKRLTHSRARGLMRSFPPLTLQAPRCDCRSAQTSCRHQSPLGSDALGGLIRMQLETPQVCANLPLLRPLNTRRAQVLHDEVHGYRCMPISPARVLRMRLSFTNSMFVPQLIACVPARRNCVRTALGLRYSMPPSRSRAWQIHSVGKLSDDVANGSGRNRRVSRLHTLSVNS